MALFAALCTIGLILLFAYLFASGQLGNVLGALFSGLTPKHNGIGGDALALVVMLVLMWVLWQGAAYVRELRQGQHNAEIDQTVNIIRRKLDRWQD